MRGAHTEKFSDQLKIYRANNIGKSYKIKKKEVIEMVSDLEIIIIIIMCQIFIIILNHHERKKKKQQEYFSVAEVLNLWQWAKCSPQSHSSQPPPLSIHQEI